MKKISSSVDFKNQVENNQQLLRVVAFNSKVKIYDSYSLNQAIMYCGREYASRQFASGIIYVAHYSVTPFRSIILHKFPGTSSQNIKYKIDEDGRVRIWADFSSDANYISLTGNKINLVPEIAPEDAILLV